MPTPPTNLILEIPSQLGDTCPVECKHCIHRNVVASVEPKLTPDQILDLIQQGRDMGVEYVNIYPHQGDISLEPPDEIQAYFRCEQTLGLKTKSVTSGINPLRLEQVLPFISKLALSVDALDEPTYSTLRPVRNYIGLMNSLELLKGYRKSGKEIFITALVMVNRMTIDNIEQRVADVCHACPFFQADLCWGGSLARGIIFGHVAEVQRACGVRTPYDTALRTTLTCIPTWLQQHVSFKRRNVIDLEAIEEGQHGTCRDHRTAYYRSGTPTS